MKDWYFLRYSMGPSELTWAELGAFLKECWWMVAFFVFVFGLRAYLLHREYKQEMEEQERLRERYGEFPVKEEIAERPPYEDTCRDTPSSQRMPDGEVPFETPNYVRPRYEWRILVSLMAIGFIIGMGGGVGSMDYALMFLFLAVLLGIVVAAGHLGPNWMVTSFEEDREKNRVNWKVVGKKMLPYGAALVIGLVLGFLRLLMRR